MLKHSSSEVVLSPPSLQLGPWLTLSSIHDERLRAVMFLTLGLVGIYLRLGFLFRKSRKQIMRVLGRL